MKLNKLKVYIYVDQSGNETRVNAPLNADEMVERGLRFSREEDGTRRNLVYISGSDS